MAVTEQGEENTVQEIVTTEVAQPVAPTSESAKAPINANEKAVWDRLTASGFTPMQTAAIMGNLQQESNYNTADQPSGLGIAQWLGARRERLMSLGSYDNLTVQVNFMIYELTASEVEAGRALKSATTLEDATIAFQNKYERCNPAYCNQEKRIEYAKSVLARYQ